MPLPTNFQFSQNNLQDYVDCPRRFELRHILRQQWPALQSEPVLEQERHVKMGSRFHEVLHQHLIDLPNDLLEAQLDDPTLLTWWHAFLAHAPIPAALTKKAAETTLTANLGGARLIAKFDLLVFTPENQAIIFDWKTNLKPTPLNHLQARVQTRFYPLLLGLAGRFPDGRPIQPAQISMVYWFANFPEQPAVIPYSPERFQRDEAEIGELIRQIQSTPPGNFILTQNTKLCSYCVYRSLCDRGSQAGSWSEMEEGETTEQTGLSLDFDQIMETEF